MPDPGLSSLPPLPVARLPGAHEVVGHSAHLVSPARVFGVRCVRRIEWPLSSMRCASWSSRSQIASAWLGSPMTACQSVTSNWLAIRVEARSARSSMTSVRSRRSASRRGAHPVVDGEQVELGEAGEEPSVGAVAATDGELVQQARHPDVAGGESTATQYKKSGPGPLSISPRAAPARRRVPSRARRAPAPPASPRARRPACSRGRTRRPRSRRSPLPDGCPR